MKFNRNNIFKLSALMFFIIALVVGSYIRFVNLFNIGFYFDTVVTQYDWATQALNSGIADFWRSFPGFFDYLPGALYLLTLVKKTSLLFGNDPQSFVIVLKSLNWIADILFISLLYYVGKRYGHYSKSQLLFFMGGMYLLPAIWFVSEVWGQIDMLLVFLVAFSSVLLFRGIENMNENSWFYKSPIFYSGIVLATALWLKLQAILLVPILVLLYITTRRWKVLWQHVLGFLIASIVFIIMPLLINADRLRQNLIQPYLRGDEVTRRAATLWGLLGFAGKGSDPFLTVGGKSISISFVGMILYSVCMIAFTIKYLKPAIKNFPKLSNVFPQRFTFFDFALFTTISSSLYFVFFTKMHSRYLHLGLLFAFVTFMAMPAKRKVIPWLIFSLILSISYFFNHIYVYIVDGVDGPKWIRDIYYSYKGNAFLTISLINVLCIIGLFLWGWRSRRMVSLGDLTDSE